MGVGARRARGLRQVAVLTAVGLGVGAVAAGSLLWHGALDHSNDEVVQRAAGQADAQLSSVLKRYGDLVAASAQELGSGALDAASFHHVAVGAQFARRYPGLQGIGFVSYAPAGGLASLKAAAAANGDPGLSIVPRGTRPYYCVGTVAEWTARVSHPPLIGFDLCAVSWVRAALLTSERSGADVVVPEKSLGKGYPSDFVLVAPYFAGHPVTTAERVRSIVGWSAALIDGKALFRALRLAASHAPVAVSLYSGGRATPATLVASSGAEHAGIAGTVVRRLTRGAPWTIRTEVSESYPGLSSPWAVPATLAVVGLLLVAALTALALTLGRARRRAEEEARDSYRATARSEARFESLAGASPIGIVETTRTLEVSYVNQRLSVIAERPAADLLGSNWIDLLHPDDRQAFVARASEAAREGRELAATVRVVRPSGEVRRVRILTAALGSRDEEDSERFVATIEDVSEEVALHEQLRHQALHDELTSLPNRTLFADRLQQAIEKAPRVGRSPAVLFLDVDRFKTVNDSLGHNAGDELLVQLADRLRMSTRGGETVARLGGDEFAVLLPEVHGIDTATAVADRILRSLEAPFRLHGRDIVTSVSIGVLLVRPDDDPDAALRSADAAMYRAKEDGRGRYAVFHEELHERSLERLTVEAEIRQGLQREEFEVFYQPLIDLASGDVMGVEALLRWRHPERGLLAPGTFIPVAEESGLIVPLGQWAFGAAVAQLAAFDADPGGPRLRELAVNLSARQLPNRQLSDDRQAVLRRHGIAPKRICLELTETAVMDDSEATRRNFQLMSEQEVTIAIDDFGTGYSSLAYLQTLPVSRLKIDRRFIAGLGTGADADAIVAAIVEMAHRLGLTVVAEGVEEEVQRQALVALGCDGAQGFLWARPMPADELRAWCRDRRPVVTASVDRR